jgi:hypothetical protein
MGKKLYITGLVAATNHVRSELAGPLDERRLENLREYVRSMRHQARAILEQHGAKLSDLPPPSRRALEFLNSLDLAKLTATPTPAALQAQPADGDPFDSLVLPGLKGLIDGFVAAIARATSDAERDKLRRTIAERAERLRTMLERRGLQPKHLTPTSRQGYRWLQFFSKPDHFAAYCRALGTARAAMHSIAATGRSAPPAIQVEFRPIAAIYRAKPIHAGVRLVLSVGMITFNRELFTDLARMIFQGGRRRTVMEATETPAYRAVQAHFEDTHACVERTAGVHHDLAESFARVCREHFQGQLPRPKLTWNQTLTHRKFGHYDFLTDTVMVSRSLDRADVPAYVLDFVMYHELLHKKLGIRWQNGRRGAHTPEFRAAERQFPQYAEAEAYLNRLSAMHR